MKKISLLLMLFIMTLVVGCGQILTGEQDTKATKTLTDAKGYKVVIPQKPQRIVSFSLSTDEILVDMLPTERIASLSYLADDEGISHVVAKSKAVKEKIQGVPSVERILALKPDLVLLADWWSPNCIDTIRDMGICVYVYKTPYTVEDVKKSIREVALVVGEKEQGERMVQEYEQKIKLAQSKVQAANLAKQKKIVVLSGHGVIGTKGSLFADICKYAQIENCMERLVTGQNTTVSKEFILQENPDIIVLPGWNGAPTHTVESKKELLEDPSLRPVKAIKDNNIVVLSGQSMYCVSHYVADAILKLDKLIYPECF